MAYSYVKVYLASIFCQVPFLGYLLIYLASHEDGFAYIGETVVAVALLDEPQLHVMICLSVILDSRRGTIPRNIDTPLIFVVPIVCGGDVSNLVEVEDERVAGIALIYVLPNVEGMIHDGIYSVLTWVFDSSMA